MKFKCYKTKREVMLGLQRSSVPDVQYRTAKIERGNLQATVSASGAVNPVALVTVGTQVSGQIRDLFVDFNAEVKAGQLLAQMLQADWARIGVRARIKTYEWGEYLKRANAGEHHVYMSGWSSDVAAADEFLTPNLTCAASRGGIKFWPESWTKHFSKHCMGIWPLRYLRPPVKPEGVKIVTFPGHPKPPDGALGQWSEEKPHRPRLEHLKWVLSQRKTDRRWRRHISRYLMPAKWVADNWRE